MGKRWASKSERIVTRYLTLMLTEQLWFICHGSSQHASAQLRTVSRIMLQQPRQSMEVLGIPEKSFPNR